MNDITYFNPLASLGSTITISIFYKQVFIFGLYCVCPTACVFILFTYK